MGDTNWRIDPASVRDYQKDLARKYKLHHPKIEQIWRSFNPSQRAEALKAGQARGEILKAPHDRSMGIVRSLVPEINLHDITGSDGSYLLDMLKHRATSSILDQYSGGVNGGPGDYAVILESMLADNLRHSEPFERCFTTFFGDGPDYGRSFHVVNAEAYALVMDDLALAVSAGFCVPQSMGELILIRQTLMLQTLNILVEDILDLGSLTRTKKKPPKKPEDNIGAALSRLILQSKPENLTLGDLQSITLDQKALLEDFLSLQFSEPMVLTRSVNVWFFTRPEMVEDEMGGNLPSHTDKYISGAFFDSIHSSITSVAVWNYLNRLLLALDGDVDKIYRILVLQEISNICHFEYSRAQKLFKRQVYSSSGSGYFNRISGAYDNGVARVVLKVDPEALTRENPQLHYMLRLCQSQTTATEAVTWAKKLGDLHRSHPSEREKMAGAEFETFCDLVVVIGFIQALSTTLTLPSANLKKGNLFFPRWQKLAAELDQLGKRIDLSEFVVPIDNLLEPGVAGGALSALDQFVVEHTGSKLGFLYEDLIEESLSAIGDLYHQYKAKFAKTEPPVPVAPFIEVTNPKLQVQQRREKEKTRPTQTSICGVNAVGEPPGQPGAQEKKPAIKVSKDTFQMFSTLFTRSKSARSVSWVSFAQAFVELGFSVVPNYGSVFTFLPPAGLGLQRSLTVHRPHGSHIEGHVLLIFARRIKRLYGWTKESFESK